MPHQNPILIRPHVQAGAGSVRIPIEGALAEHRLPERLGENLLGWYVSEDGRELVICDGSVWQDNPMGDMVEKLAGCLPDFYIVSHDEDQNIKFALTLGLITEVECMAGYGTVRITPFQEFIPRCKYRGLDNTQDFNTELHLLLEMASRPAHRSAALVTECAHAVAFEIDLRLNTGKPAIEDLFTTGALLSFLARLEQVTGFVTEQISTLRASVERDEAGAFEALLKVLGTTRRANPDPDVDSLTRVLPHETQLPRLLAAMGPGMYPDALELWPAARILDQAIRSAADPRWPPELVQIGARADDLVSLDRRFGPAPVIVSTTGTRSGFVEESSDLFEQCAFSLDSAHWR
jgi:hypothetical protein